MTDREYLGEATALSSSRELVRLFMRHGLKAAVARWARAMGDEYEFRQETQEWVRELLLPSRLFDG